MRTKFSLVFFYLLCCVSAVCWGQSADNADEVVKIETYNMNGYRPDELIVKFRDNTAVNMPSRRMSAFATSSVSAIDRMFASLGVDSVEELMPMTGSRVLPDRIRAYNGDELEVRNLGKLFRLKLNRQAMAGRSIFQVIDTLRNLHEVEYAEPNYIVYNMSTGVVDSTAYVAEPFYSQQWGLSAINLPALWAKSKVTTRRPVIAILDTGVDILHPDLQANIWTNSAEANGQEGADDDDNGFVDDLHGWDFVNERATISDYNGHGTHCAGIAAAVGNNGIGITGANPDAYIMPLAVLQSSGSGDVATIIRGIDYASANGADVISMSLGGYGYSLAEEQALTRAYATSVLVAAAGNDNKCIYEHYCNINKRADNAPMYPAAFSFVLGVEASSDSIGTIASFSNYDEDGPVFSEYDETRLYNYELRAPGTNIYSTFPNGRYKSLNGTSMACPLVAGAISRLLQCKTDSDLVSKEVLFGDLIKSRTDLGNVDMLKVYNSSDSVRQPSLQLVGITMTDTLSGDGDERYDAGETIEWYPSLRNMNGYAQNIKYWIRFGFYNQGDWVDEDSTLYEIINDTAMFGWSLSSYAKNVSLNPVRFTLSDIVSDGRVMNVTLFATCDNCQDTLVQKLDFPVENGVEIGGMITEDLTLYPDVHYIVVSNLAVPDNVSLTIKPGAVLRFKSNTGLSIATGAIIDIVGKPDSMIVFTQAEHGTGENFFVFENTVLEYVSFDGFNRQGYNDNIINGGIFRNCVFTNFNLNCYMFGASWTNYPMLEKCNIHNNVLAFFPISSGSTVIYEDCNIINNLRDYYDENELVSATVNNNSPYSCNWINNPLSLNFTTSTPVVYQTAQPCYFGTSVESIARQQIYDMNAGNGFGHYDLSNMLTQPNPDAHGIVWKVLIDGWDAQDEYDSLPPLGVGTHSCSVYFSRAVDTTAAPSVTFGVKAPYTQHSMANGTWSADSTIYTTQFTIDSKTASDGVNRIYVYGAKDDEHFDVPYENRRFNINIQAAGSMSTGLMAEAGLGKVKLSWETDEEDYDDLLGYNLYRWTEDTIYYNCRWERDENGVRVRVCDWRIDTTVINTELIDAQDTSFTDYDVIPGKPYFYTINQMTTSLTNYQISNPVVATPLTAQKGDANGSMSVDVADVVTEANYILGGTPAPFIFEAADVNENGEVNVLDVVGTINLIMNPASTTQGVNGDVVYYYEEDGMLYLESDVVIGGVQLRLKGDSANMVITAQEALDRMEKMGLWQNGGYYILLSYSMSGKSLLPGVYPLIETGGAELEEMVLSDMQGRNVPAIHKAPASLSTIEKVQMMQCYPNPFRNEINIHYVIGREAREVSFVMTDITGRTIESREASAMYGENRLNWVLSGDFMPGVYFVTLTVDGKKIQTVKIICQK